MFSPLSEVISPAITAFSILFAVGMVMKLTGLHIVIVSGFTAPFRRMNATDKHFTVVWLLVVVLFIQWGN